MRVNSDQRVYRNSDVICKTEGRNEHNVNEEIMDLLMALSHDIRSPLIAMTAIVKLLTKGVYGGMEEAVKERLHDLQGRMTTLLGIAEDYLGKASTVADGTREDQTVLNLCAEVIDPVLEEFSPVIEAKGIVIDKRLGVESSKGKPIRADRTWLRFVFRNLLANAIKFAGEGCRIAMALEIHDRYYKCNVYNSGAPIPENLQDKLFTRFRRSKHDGNNQGTGLGLYMVKKAIKKHGGDIWYEPGKTGSNFVFTLPHD